MDEHSKPCSTCGGSGWKYVDVGNEKKVSRCDCYFKSQALRLLEAAQIPARYAKCAFSNYRTDRNPILAKAKLDVQTWAGQYPLDRTGLLLFGVSGVGKTHLASAALKELAKKGFHCLFVDYRDLLKQIQNSYNPSVEATELELLQPLFDTEVLLLDDLGAVKPTYWVWDTVSLILNNRYNANRTTLITSNFIDGPAAGSDEAEEQRLPHEGRDPVSANPERSARRKEETLGDRIGNRMRSRLFEMCRPILVVGQDYRRELRAAGFG
ncbi:MAG TPA: ATP-binding protein [Terriglobales bacterium]|nr:ATP-binding protein [Terriglobales bacterium]